MCGFMGVLHRSVEKNRQPLRWESVEPLLKHRGPDDRGIYSDPHGRMDILFRRLSIIDVEGGHQPVFNADQTVAVVLNGEIYNYKELRAELISEGCQLRTEGDSEVIAHLYDRMGPRLVERLEGMFSILLWDEKTGVLHVFRDRFGIKPLYLAKGGQHFAFASEIKPLLRLPGVSREISMKGLSDYLSFGYTLAENTLFKDVFKVLPATRLEVSKEGIQEFKYWELSAKEDRDWSKNQLLKEFDRSIELHLRSDVKVGAFLSGGFDSGLVVARAMAQGGNLSTYTIRFEEAPLDESPVAAEIAKRYGTRHHTIDVRGTDFLKSLPELCWAFDEPLADSGIFPNFWISRVASNDGCKVVLAGTGGDELFAGYTYHVRSPFEMKFKNVEPMVRWMGSLVGGELGRKLYRTGSYDTDPLAHYLGHTAVFAEPSTLNTDLSSSPRKGEWITRFKGSPQTARLYADLKTYVPDNLMLLFDRTTMASGVEGRVPFLHHPLVEKAIAVPESARTPGGQRKALLKEMCREFLPASLYELPKQGFSSPMKNWMEGELGVAVWRVLKSQKFQTRPWWTPGAITESRLRSFNFHQLWTLFQLELFCRVHMDQDLSFGSDLNLDDLTHAE